MSNYSNCRDSYVQYQHLAKSHNVLYHEWMDDNALPTPDQILRNLPHRSHGSDSAVDDQDDMTVPAGTSVDNDMEDNVGFTVSDKYWDFFCDDEQWEIFHSANLTVEPNGNLMFNRMITAQGPLDTLGGSSIGRNIYRGDDANGASNTHNSKDDVNIDHITNNSRDNGNSEKDIVVGSAFDPRTLQNIKQKVDGWTNGFPNLT